MCPCWDYIITCNSCQPARVHSSQTYREHENRHLPRISLLDHAPTARPNVRTAVCNEKVPGKEDMWLPQRTLRETCENAKRCWISTDDGYVPFPFQHFLFNDSKNACLDIQHFTIKCNGSHCQGQELRLLRRVSMFWCCWTKDAFRRTLFSEDFFPHISCCTGSLLSALEVYLIVHRLVGGSSKGHSCWSQWGLRWTW